MIDNNLDQFLENILSYWQENIHTNTVGHIIGYDHITGMAQIQIDISKLLPDDEVIDLPPLVNVPVVPTFRGGGYFISTPVKSGDTGVIHFMENSIDDWLIDGKLQEPTDYRMHDYSDAVFNPGVSHSKNPLKFADPDAMVFGTEDGKLLLKLRLDHSISLKNEHVNADISSDGDINIKNDKAFITIDKDGNVKVKGADTLEMEASGIKLIGNTEIDGMLTVNENISATGVITSASDVVAGGISTKGHEHMAPMGMTSPPIG